MPNSLTKQEWGADLAPHKLLLERIYAFKQKLHEGEYLLTSNPCFCGNKDDDIEVRKYDRFTIPHRMVVCKNCGIIRANPCLSNDSLIKFYQKDYRDIYDVFEYKTQNIDEEKIYIQKTIEGQSLAEFIKYFDINPKIVFDIGCNNGAMLEGFKEMGCECYGVDYDINSINFGKKKHHNVILGSLKQIKQINKKADLIILNHVLEHIIDIEKFLNDLHELLSPKGLLYVSVPGLLTSDRELIWQNAHIWQFTADTLSYVMKCCGYDDYYLDENINSIWAYTGEKQPKSNVNKRIFNTLNNYFQRKPILPFINTFNKFSFKERKNNIDKNLSYRYKDISHLFNELNDKKAIIIGGAPSVDNYIQYIKEMQANGAVVLTIERMNLWCIKNGIKPNYVVCMDACDDICEGFKEIDKDSKFLLASQAHNSAFEMLQGRDVYIFNLPQKGISQQEYWHKYGYKNATVVNAGGSVTLGAIVLAIILGSKDLHIFGFDCHITNGNYAKGIAGVGCIHNQIEIFIEGKKFLTTASYLSFMQQFFILMSYAQKAGNIKNVYIYGDSLIKHASEEDIDGDKLIKGDING